MLCKFFFKLFLKSKFKKNKVVICILKDKVFDNNYVGNLLNYIKFILNTQQNNNIYTFGITRRVILQRFLRGHEVCIFTSRDHVNSDESEET